MMIINDTDWMWRNTGNCLEEGERAITFTHTPIKDINEWIKAEAKKWHQGFGYTIDSNLDPATGQEKLMVTLHVSVDSSD